MADMHNTKVELAAGKLDLHRSSPYSAEITAPDGTRVLACGEEILSLVEQVVVESTDLPAVPDWVAHPSSSPTYVEGLADEGVWK